MKVTRDVSSELLQTIKNWAILCPGPSLKSCQHVMNDPGGIIAVNGAILKCQSKLDWWVMGDPEVFTTVSQKIDLELVSKKTKLWLFWNFETTGLGRDGGRWDPKTFEIYKQFEVEFWKRKKDNVTMDRAIPVLIDPFPETVIPWNEFSMFQALALAIQKGAQTIRLYGADMKGLGYYHSGLTNWRMNHSEKRWIRERHFLKHIKAECERRDIQILVLNEGGH